MKTNHTIDDYTQMIVNYQSGDGDDAILIARGLRLIAQSLEKINVKLEQIYPKYQ